MKEKKKLRLKRVYTSKRLEVYYDDLKLAKLAPFWMKVLLFTGSEEAKEKSNHSA